MGNAETNDKLIHITTYFNPTNCDVVALNLIANGVGIFERATCVLKFESLKILVQKKDYSPPFKDLSPFIFDNIMDKTRIITCFENYIKAELLCNGYIVHYVEKTHKSMKKTQEKRPLKIEEIFTKESFEKLHQKAPNELDLKEITIGFSQLLKSDYSNKAGIKDEIVTILKNINKERNRLHFMNNQNYSIGNKIISDLDTLIKFVRQVMIPRMAELDSKIINRS